MTRFIFPLIFLEKYLILKKKQSGRKSKPKTWNYFFNMLHMIMRFCTSGSFSQSFRRHANQIQNELANLSREAKEAEKARQNLPTNLLAILVPGVLLTESSSPLHMWGGAVNRQPGYRARNLQRRGFLSTRHISRRSESYTKLIFEYKNKNKKFEKSKMFCPSGHHIEIFQLKKFIARMLQSS